MYLQRLSGDQKELRGNSLNFPNENINMNGSKKKKKDRVIQNHIFLEYFIQCHAP